MAFDQERLAELLCARLCHDLAGAVGAVSAGAELLAEEGTASPMAAEAVSLLADSAASMAARLRFLRLALGTASASAPNEARALAVAFLEKGFPQGEWKLDWPMAQAAAKSPDQAKLLGYFHPTLSQMNICVLSLWRQAAAAPNSSERD